MTGAITPTDRRRPVPVVRACRVCGCTDNRACEGGCHWVALDLCSACQAHQRPTLTRADQVRAVVAAGGRILRSGRLCTLVDREGQEIPAWQTACNTVLQEQGR